MGKNILFTSLSVVFAYLFAYEINVSIEHWRNDTDRENRITRRNMYPSTTWSNTNPIRNGVKTNLFLRGERLKALIVFNGY